MTINPQEVQAAPTVPSRQSNAEGTNNNVQQRTFNKSAPWTIHLAQGASQALFQGVQAQIGFDTQSFKPTYQALGTTVYSLGFTAFSIYPYSIITVPQYGLYDIRFALTINSFLSEPWIEITGFIFKNGLLAAELTNNGYAGVGTTNISVLLSDILELNPGDEISFFATMNNGATGADAVTQLAEAIIRYQGVS